MNYKQTTFKNGLRLVTVPIKGLESAAITVWVGVGSRYEEKEHSGISHFLEHMAFKGGKKYKTASAVSEAIDSIGAQNNAATSREWTNFYIKAHSEQLGKAFDILSDIILNASLKEDDIETERGVILEEIAMTEDTPIQKIGDIFTQLVFGDTPMGRDISGTRETVKAIKKKDFANYREKHYGGKNMVITVAGRINEDEINKFVDEHFANVPAKKEETAEEFSWDQKKPNIKVDYKDSEQAHFILGYRGLSRTSEDRYAEAVLATILGRGMSSRLFTEIREKRGLAYGVSTSSSHYVDTGVFLTYAGVDKKRIEEAIKVVLDEKKSIADKEKPIEKEELKKAKEYIKGGIALSLENTISVNDFFGKRVMFLEKMETPEELFDKIDKVELSDVYKVAKETFVPEKLNLAIIGPYKSTSRFEKLLQ